MSLFRQVALLTGTAVAVLVLLGASTGSPISLWLTPDQQGRLAFENTEWARAAELFEDPMWKGAAAYMTGDYESASAEYGRNASATAFYNRGNAFMKSFDYAKAIGSYEVAVAEAPDWHDAAENLDLARYTLEYIQRAREQGDTGDESELGADEYKFDNTEGRGREMTVTRQSTIELASAEKWMRSVDTNTSEFLRIRFQLESRRAEAP